MLEQALWVHIYGAPLCLEGLVFLVSSILTGSYNLCASSSAEFLNLWVGFWWKQPIWELVFQGLSLSAFCPVVDLCVCSYLRQEETSLMMAEKIMIYEYSRKSLEVILFQCSLSWTVVFGFSPMSLSNLALGSGLSKKCQAWVPSMAWTLIPIR